jgi:hypothetical protein
VGENFGMLVEKGVGRAPNFTKVGKRWLFAKPKFMGRTAVKCIRGRTVCEISSSEAKLMPQIQWSIASDPHGAGFM